MKPLPRLPNIIVTAEMTVEVTVGRKATAWSAAATDGAVADGKAVPREEVEAVTGQRIAALEAVERLARSGETVGNG